MRALSLLKQFLPGTIRWFSFGLGISLNYDENRPQRGKSRITTDFHWPQIQHKPGQKLQGWPGQYEEAPNTTIHFFTSRVSIGWKPWDYLSEEDYNKRYGTYEPLEPTKWDIQKEKERAQRLLRNSK